MKGLRECNCMHGSILLFSFLFFGLEVFLFVCSFHFFFFWPCGMWDFLAKDRTQAHFIGSVES